MQITFKSVELIPFRAGARNPASSRARAPFTHLLVDTLGMVVARRVEAANVSDRRVGARLLAGLQSGFPSIRTVMADAGYESRKLAHELKRRHGWRLHITKRRQRAFKGGGPDLDRGAHVCVAGQKSSLDGIRPSNCTVIPSPDFDG